ncbi:hypothetical protein [[Clostridium] fimetarium]|uniref:Uncharacterized protein n=1 Tax=[Clostridium] fimetarium TaxID=99656 RepID=A0A1I0NHL3_9FIRM|nr:hypothetical protein [[Clostridium] fimetarium]SEW00923.1 hypothetical protein SAMN05421659_103115 [[Clostridium] fimetarium]
MKEIFHEFGTIIISIITAVLVIGILFGISVSGNHGILIIAGASTNKEMIDYTTYSDFDAVVMWHKRSKPEVAYTSTFGRFFAIENANFLNRYNAKDMEGVIYPMDKVILAKLFTDTMFGKVLDIRKVDGISVMSLYSAIDGSVHFASAGIYEVYFQIRDRENLTSVWKIPIAVDERRD